MMPIEVWSRGRWELAEGPVWDERRRALWWVDILRGAVLVQRWGDDAPVEYAVPGEMVGTLALSDDDRVVLATTNGIAWLDPETGDIDIALDLPAERELGNRMNDGKAGPDGAFYVGSMPLASDAAKGTLHRWRSGGEAVRLVDGIGASNGLDWSLDERVLYFIDTAAATITLYRAEDAAPLGRTFDLSSYPGIPDGMTIDAEGCLWVCFWQGAAIRRFSPEGALLQEIALPVDKPTSCAFGGPDLDRLFITTAAFGLDEPGLAAQPAAGSVLVLEPGVRGRLPYRVALP